MRVDNNLTGTIHIDNGSIFPFPPIKMKADLYIEKSQIIWERDRKSIECKIKNKGTKDSGAFYIRFYTKQKNKASRFLMQRYIPKLKKNEVFNYSFNIMRIAHNYENNLNDINKFIIKVDYNNKVEEYNEKNNIETITVNTSYVPTPPTLNLNSFYPYDSNGEQYTKINFDLKKFKIIETEDYGVYNPFGANFGKNDEPYIWVYGIKIDLQSLLNDEYIIQSKNYGHGNIKSMGDGKTAMINNNVGNMSFDLTPIPIVTAACMGIIVIVMEEDAGPSNNAIKQGYRAGARKINEIISGLKSIKKLKKLAKDVDISMVGINIDNILKDLQSDVEKTIIDSATKGAIRLSLKHVVSDTLYAVGAAVDSDDKIGTFTEFCTYTDIKKVKNKDFSHDIRGDGAHYRISGSISAQTPSNNYKSFKHQLKYGDIILFSSEAGTSDLIQIPTNSKWSHVAIVYQEATQNHDVMILEATPTNGVSLVSLGSKVKNYDGDISVRHLNVQRVNSMQNALSNLYRELRGRKYESKNTQGLKELSNAAIDTLDKQGGQTLNQENLSKVFCSELVAEAYQRMNLLSSTNPLYPSNEFIPKDFSEEGELDLLQGELLKELIIKK